MILGKVYSNLEDLSQLNILDILSACLHKYFWQIFIPGEDSSVTYLSCYSNLALSLADNKISTLSNFESVNEYFYVPFGFVSYLYHII